MNKTSDVNVMIPSANQNEESMAENRILGISQKILLSVSIYLHAFQGEILNDPRQ